MILKFSFEVSRQRVFWWNDFEKKKFRTTELCPGHTAIFFKFQADNKKLLSYLCAFY